MMIPTLKSILCMTLFVFTSCQPAVTPAQEDDSSVSIGVGSTSTQNSPDPVVPGTSDDSTTVLPTGPDSTTVLPTGPDSTTVLPTGPGSATSTPTSPVPLPSVPDAKGTVETEETSGSSSTEVETGTPVAPVGEKKIVNLKVSFTDRDGNPIWRTYNTTGDTSESIEDNHGRILCSTTNLKCHTTYYEGTEIVIKSPINVFLTGVSGTQVNIGWECNGVFAENPMVKKLEAGFAGLNSLQPDDFGKKFVIEEDMDCFPVYRPTANRR